MRLEALTAANKLSSVHLLASRALSRKPRWNWLHSFKWEPTGVWATGAKFGFGRCSSTPIPKTYRSVRAPFKCRSRGRTAPSAADCSARQTTQRARAACRRSFVSEIVLIETRQRKTLSARGGGRRGGGDSEIGANDEFRHPCFKSMYKFLMQNVCKSIRTSSWWWRPCVAKAPVLNMVLLYSRWNSLNMTHMSEITPDATRERTRLFNQNESVYVDLIERDDIFSPTRPDPAWARPVKTLEKRHTFHAHAARRGLLVLTPTCCLLPNCQASSARHPTHSQLYSI